jgi:hypothetical protein
MNKTVSLCALVCALSAATAAFLTPYPAQADNRHDHHDNDHGHDHHPYPAWGHDDIWHFGRHDVDIWRGGHWVHGYRGSRLGWWWVVAGVWYFFPQPVYPYPDPYVPPTIVVTPSAPAPAAAPTTSPPTEYWYYCKSANAYYPYVASCPEGWQKVPSTPPPAPTNTTPPPPANQGGG